MKNNKYKKALALVLSASIVMPCHATNPQYTQNPNTGLHVQRAAPSPEDTPHRAQPKPANSRNYGSLLCGLLSLFGAGAIATVRHNTTGPMFNFAGCENLVKQYGLPVDSSNYVRLNKLRVYVHKDLCKSLNTQPLLYVNHVENRVLPNITSGDFFPCATHIYLNNTCNFDDKFKASDYKLVSDEASKIGALRCIWGIKDTDAYLPSRPCLGQTDSPSSEKDPEQSDIDAAITKLTEFQKTLQSQQIALQRAFKSLTTPVLLASPAPDLATPSRARAEDAPAGSMKTEGSSSHNNGQTTSIAAQSPVQPSPETTTRKRATSAPATPQASAAATHSWFEHQFLAEINPYKRCSIFIGAVSQLGVSCTSIINESRAVEILQYYQSNPPADLKEPLTTLEGLVKSISDQRTFCADLVARCRNYGTALNSFAL